MDKKISIIIPCYNVEHYIDRCFESLLHQTIGIEQMELIFVNDASTDGTLQKLSAYEQEYPESVLVIHLEENCKQGYARNVALQYASAPYIGYVDSDDFVDVHMFEDMICVMEEHDCDFVECDWNFFSENEEEFTTNAFKNSLIGFQDFTNQEVKEQYIVEQLFFTSMWTKVFKKTFLLEHNIFCLEGVRYEDMYFCYFAILYANSYYHIPKPYYHYFLNPEGTVQQRKLDQQMDMMDVAVSFLMDARETGLYLEYKNIIDWMFLEKYFVYMLWDIWDMAPEEAYHCYIQMKEGVTMLVPDYGCNPFRKLECNHLDDFILKLLDYDLTESQFKELMLKLKRQQES